MAIKKIGSVHQAEIINTYIYKCENQECVYKKTYLYILDKVKECPVCGGLLKLTQTESKN
jgi:rRNA maturation endonuclease Nob1